MFLFLFPTVAIAASTPPGFQDAGPFKVHAQVDPEVPRVGRNRITVWVQDESGKSVPGAALDVVAVMPSMGSMPAMYAPAEMTEIETGRYEGEFEPAMSGEWPLTIEITSDTGRRASITFDLATGRKGLRCSTCSGASARVPGTVHVDPTRRQLIGVTTGRVRQRNLQVVIRAPGVVAYDETRLRDIALKFNGWVGDLYADAIGQVVKQGEPLFTVYSPELLAAQEEYLEIVRRGSTVKTSDRHRIEATRRRLRLWDLRDSQINALEKRGTAMEYVPILSPASGVVIERNVVAGSAFRMSQQLLRIADVSRVWVEAQVYDFELPLIQAGMKAEVILPDMQERKFEASVDYVYPFMEAGTNTARIRIVLDNTDGLLRPAMFAQVRLQAQLGRRLVVPESAVLYSGENRVVFLDVGDGRYAPRKIKTGQRNGQWIEVLEGLAEDDLVVTSGTFLIAAESKLKAGLEQW